MVPNCAEDVNNPNQTQIKSSQDNCPTSVQCNWLDCEGLGLDPVSCGIACNSSQSNFCGLCDPAGNCVKITTITDANTCDFTNVCWLPSGEILFNLTEVCLLYQWNVIAYFSRTSAIY